MFIQICKNIYVHVSNAQISEVRERNGKRTTISNMSSNLF